MTAQRRILLINPTITSRRSARFPLAVLSLATSLEGRVRDAASSTATSTEISSRPRVRAMREERFDAVGVTVMGGPQLPTAIAVSKAIRAALPATPIIWGGYFPTICPVPSINAPYVDYVVRGQGEDTLAELLDALFDGSRRRAGRDRRTHLAT